jgi:hypothetical protein
MVGSNFRCVHCLGFFQPEELTADHIIPASWYPKSFPRNLEKPQAPSCNACNAKLGKAERALLIRLGLCLDRDSSHATGIPEKVMRALDPNAGSGAKDSEHRRALRKKVLAEVIPPELISPAAIIPGFGPSDDSLPADRMAIGLEKKLVDAVGEKLVRGSTYYFSKKFIEPGHEITTVFMDPRSNPFVSVLDRFGRSIEVGPGLRMRRAGDAPEDPVCGVFEFVFWDRFTIYASVIQNQIREAKFG